VISRAPSQNTGPSGNSDGPVASLIFRSDLLGPRPGLICAAAVTALLGLVITGAVFGEILEQVLDDGWFGTDVDLALSNFTVEHRTGWFTVFMRQVTDLGGTAALVAVTLSTIGGMLMLRRVRLASVMATAAVGSSALTLAMKAIIERPRPLTNGEIIFASDSSFPSGHTLESAAIYGALVFILGSLVASRRARLGVWAIGTTVALAIGASRVYLGVHWASDVAAGWMLGLALVAGTAGLVTLDERVANFLQTDARTQVSRLQSLGARSSILGIVGLAVLTAFLVGVQFEV
jgi:undecaprenyl-diphosphatase